MGRGVVALASGAASNLALTCSHRVALSGLWWRRSCTQATPPPSRAEVWPLTSWLYCWILTVCRIRGRWVSGESLGCCGCVRGELTRSPS